MVGEERGGARCGDFLRPSRGWPWESEVAVVGSWWTRVDCLVETEIEGGRPESKLGKPKRRRLAAGFRPDGARSDAEPTTSHGIV